MSKKELRESNIERLEILCETELSSEILALDDAQLDAVDELVAAVLEREREGFDRFFESISQTLKYIPNFIVLAITNKYIDPPIAARITSKLPLKNAVQIAKGLSVEYICGTAVFLDERYAAELLGKLPKKQARAVVEELVLQHPLRVLDIFEFSSPSLIGLVDFDRDAFTQVEKGLNELRRKTLKKLGISV